MIAKSILNVLIAWWSLGRGARFIVNCLRALSAFNPCPPCSSFAVNMRSVLGVLAYFPLIFIRAAGVRQC
ncbi:hypothetical protein CPB85DRAFT_1336661 [Mucidula mucida]|nr:hypothetical protein CPB85DRAFT_1336661 [Mucidula mucida]